MRKSEIETHKTHSSSFLWSLHIWLCSWSKKIPNSEWHAVKSSLISNRQMRTHLDLLARVKKRTNRVALSLSCSDSLIHHVGKSRIGFTLFPTCLLIWLWLNRSVSLKKLPKLLKVKRGKRDLFPLLRPAIFARGFSEVCPFYFCLFGLCPML